MNNPSSRLFLAFAAFVGNLLAIPYIGLNFSHLVGYAIFSLCVILLPIYVLCSSDALKYISRSSSIGTSQKTVTWLIACLPVLTFGILATGIGAAIIVWILYNLFVERQPEFTDPLAFGGLGLGPIMLIFGLYCLRSLWTKRINS